MKVRLSQINKTSQTRTEFCLELLKVAEKIGKSIASLKKAARKYNIPVVYVNDNFGKWKSDFHSVIESVIKENRPGIKIPKSFSSLFIHLFISRKSSSRIITTT